MFWRSPPRPRLDNPADAIQWIDIHNHFRIRHIDHDFTAPMQSALSVMKNSGISLMIAFPWGHTTDLQSIEDFKKSRLKNSSRFFFMAAPDNLPKSDFSTSAGGAMRDGRVPNTPDKLAPKSSVSNEQLRKLEQDSEEILRQGACGFGELFFYHLVGTLDDGGVFCSPADSPAMLLLADIAARHDVPLDVHMDLIDEDVAVPPDIAYLFHNMLPEFERLLSHNPKARIIWEHVGSWAGSSSGHCTPDLCRRLLTQHPNLYMSLRIHGFRFCWTEAWQQLFLDFPDRFMIGRDCFYPLSQDGKSPPRTQAGFEDSTTRTFLDRLPPDVARKIAYENAIKLFHLNDSARKDAERQNVN